MSISVYLLTICLPLATLLLIFGMKYFALIQQAKARREQDEAYRVLAERSAQAQTDATARLISIDGSLATLNARLATIEKILKEVE